MNSLCWDAGSLLVCSQLMGLQAPAGRARQWANHVLACLAQCTGEGIIPESHVGQPLEVKAPLMHGMPALLQQTRRLLEVDLWQQEPQISCVISRCGFRNDAEFLSVQMFGRTLATFIVT